MNVVGLCSWWSDVSGSLSIFIQYGVANCLSNKLQQYTPPIDITTFLNRFNKHDFSRKSLLTYTAFPLFLVSKKMNPKRMTWLHATIIHQMSWLRSTECLKNPSIYNGRVHRSATLHAFFHHVSSTTCLLTNVFYQNVITTTASTTYPINFMQEKEH